MNEDTMGRKETELTQPQTEPETPEVAHGNEEDIDKISTMSSAEFAEYLNNLGNEEEDAETDAETPEEEEQPEEEEVGEPHAEDKPAFKTFATEKEYEDDKANAINEAFNKRFKGVRERDELLERIKRSAKGYYGDAEDPIQAMLNDLDAQIANENGQSVEDYRLAQNDASELEQYRRAKREQDQRMEAEQRIVAEWRRGEEQLKEIDPSFSLDEAMKNPAFANQLTNGASVAQAYLATRPKPKPKRREIAQNAQSAVKGTGETQRNPATMKTEDFLAYINERKGN